MNPQGVATVDEMSPTELDSWLSEFGDRDFGWRRVPSLDALQDPANQGEVALVIGRFRHKVERPIGYRRGSLRWWLPEIMSPTLRPVNRRFVLRKLGIFAQSIRV